MRSVLSVSKVCCQPVCSLCTYISPQNYLLLLLLLSISALRLFFRSNKEAPPTQTPPPSGIDLHVSPEFFVLLFFFFYLSLFVVNLVHPARRDTLTVAWGQAEFSLFHSHRSTLKQPPLTVLFLVEESWGVSTWRRRRPPPYPVDLPNLGVGEEQKLHFC